ncbi:hypothetical protein G7Y41_07845 [Schaalia sp. ZJ405]|uniref:hypothetical protein n=1 Tax=Schaalia sp. ZJ405 TaxID=2709403 RepID=UPI0013EBD22E|nr:hypothetical protein [Schaalia sp. ZJ405]QPK80953.1 hypothetical protein G7Y41_07845 [Schaalia sp. ZJ405]
MKDQIRCLEDRGWSGMKLVYEGGVIAGYQGPEITDGNWDVIDEDTKECEQLYPLVQPKMTRQWAEITWEKQNETYECVKALGYVLPNVPSKETLIENAVATGILDWDPRGDALQSDRSKMTYWELADACPYAF